MEQDVQPESSPEQVEPVESPLDAAVKAGDDAAFKAIRLAQRAGQPIPQVSPSSAVTATAEPAKQVASTDASSETASEPVKSPKHDANSRIRQLANENRELKARLDRLERQPAPDVKQAETSTAKPRTDAERYLAMPDAPKFENFDTIEAYSVAASLYVIEQREREKEQAQTSRSAQESIEAMFKRGHDEFVDFEEVRQAAARDGVVVGPELGEIIAKSEIGHRMLHAIATARAKSFSEQLAAMAPFMVKQPEKEPEPQHKTTKAPPPPVFLGQKPTDQGDPEMSAVSTEDWSAFKAAKLAKRAAAVRR